MCCHFYIVASSEVLESLVLHQIYKTRYRFEASPRGEPLAVQLDVREVLLTNSSKKRGSAGAEFKQGILKIDMPAKPLSGRDGG